MTLRLHWRLGLMVSVCLIGCSTDKADPVAQANPDQTSSESPADAKPKGVKTMSLNEKPTTKPAETPAETPAAETPSEPATPEPEMRPETPVAEEPATPEPMEMKPETPMPSAAEPADTKPSEEKPAVAKPATTVAAKIPPLQLNLTPVQKLMFAVRERPWDKEPLLALAAGVEKDDPGLAELIRINVENTNQQIYSNPELRAKTTALSQASSPGWSEGMAPLVEHKNALDSYELGMLQEINLTEPVDEDIDLIIAQNPEVRAVFLSSPKLTMAGWDKVIALPQLDQLSFDGEVELTPELLGKFEQLAPWARINFWIDGDYDREAVAAMNARRYGRFNDLNEEQKLMACERFLRTFEYTGELGEPIDFVSMSQSGVVDMELAFLAAKPGLKGVDISEADVTTKGIENLAGATDLEFLSLMDTRVDSIASLKGLTKLKNLSLYPTYDVEMGDDGLEGLENFKQLEDLYLTDEAAGEKTVRRLAGMTKMKKLDLSTGKVEDPEAYAVLADMNDLETLSIHSGGLDSSVLKYLEGKDKLTLVNLSIDQGSPEPFQVLAKLKNVKRLYLSGDGVTDEAIANLAPMTQLSVLMAQGSAVTPEGAKALVAKMPNMTVILDEAVVKTPVEKYVFQRHKLRDNISISYPSEWPVTSDVEGDFFLKESGWDQIGSWSGDVGPVEIRFFDWYADESAEDAVKGIIENNSHADPKVLKRDVVKVAGFEKMASCIFENSFGKHFVFAGELNGKTYCVEGSAPATRFDEFYPLMVKVAESIRVSDDPQQHADEKVDVLASELQPK
ncbi:hypothetical protein AB1L30_22810 [Bremerella sp. JC817]|uniref:hypothetical protein n=1 Tax=Bremerella sp. JC817 TaxID=3231756 RepID=UPI003458FD67